MIPDGKYRYCNPALVTARAGFTPADNVCCVTEATGIPSGWYPDPAGAPGQMRYWNGTAWGEPPATKRRNKLWLGIGVVVIGLLGIYLAAAPYITVYRMKSAAENRDAETLSEFIEFPSVRQSLKDQLNANIAQEMASDNEMADNPFAAIGSALAGTLVEKMVDAYVTPAGITRLMAGESLKPDRTDSGNSGRDPFADASMGYQSFDKFAVTVRDDDGEDIKFVLSRRGIGWRLTDVIVPQ